MYSTFDEFYINYFLSFCRRFQGKYTRPAVPCAKYTEREGCWDFECIRVIMALVTFVRWIFRRSSTVSSPWGPSVFRFFILVTEIKVWNVYRSSGGTVDARMYYRCIIYFERVFVYMRMRLPWFQGLCSNERYFSCMIYHVDAAQRLSSYTNLSNKLDKFLEESGERHLKSELALFSRGSLAERI